VSFIRILGRTAWEERRWGAGRRNCGPGTGGGPAARRRPAPTKNKKRWLGAVAAERRGRRPQRSHPSMEWARWVDAWLASWRRCAVIGGGRPTRAGRHAMVASGVGFFLIDDLESVTGT